MPSTTSIFILSYYAKQFYWDLALTRGYCSYKSLFKLSLYFYWNTYTTDFSN